MRLCLRNTMILTILLGFAFYEGRDLYAQDSNGVSNDPQKAIDELFEVLAKKPESIPIPTEIILSGDFEANRRFTEKRNKILAEREAKIGKAVSSLAKLGDSVIDPLLERCRQEKKGTFLKRAIEVLRKVGTPRARQILLDIALEQDIVRKGDPASSWSAHNFLEITDDTSQIKELLASNSEGIIGMALQALVGVEVDAELMTHLEEALQSNSFHLRTTAARVIAEDPLEKLAERKVKALVESLRTVQGLPGANEKFQIDRIGTLADNLYYLLTDALTKIKGADDQLRDISEQVSGAPQRCIMIALAIRGEQNVKKNLYEIIQDPNMVRLAKVKALALQGLANIGTNEDLQFLKNIAESDPLQIVDLGGPLYEVIGEEVILEGKRMAPVPDKDSSRWQNARRSYPIRTRAEEAVREIQTPKRTRDRLSVKAVNAKAGDRNRWWILGMIAVLVALCSGALWLLMKRGRAA